MRIHLNQVDGLANKFLDKGSSYFRFLSEFGFCDVDKEMMGSKFAALLYKKENIELKVSYDSYSYEINCYLNYVKSKQKVDLQDLVEFFGVEKSLGFLVPQAATCKDIDAVLLKISGFISYHQEIFEEDVSFLNDLENFRENNLEKNISKFKLNPIREKANNAWRNKEYDKVIRLYSSVEECLGKVERERLSYARRYLEN